jgi:hypothetical protein
LARRANQRPSGKNLSSPNSKNILLNTSGKSVVCLRASHPTRGALRNVTNVRWDAVDAKAATDERGFGGRRSRVVLAPRCWRQVARKCPRDDGGKTAGHRGEREVSRKTIAQGRPDASAEPVCSCACSCAHFAHETAGAARTRSSLRPLFSKRAELDENLGRTTPREGERTFGTPSLRGAKRRSNPLFLYAARWIASAFALRATADKSLRSQ